jgi:ketosteroid isomerase-like protein
VATLGRYSCVVKETGKSVDCAVAHFFTIRDGKIAQFFDFLDTAQFAAAYAGAVATAHR